MRRAITIVQRQGHEHHFRQKQALGPGKDCSTCRHAELREVNDTWEFVCCLSHAGPATTCPHFKDARESRVLNWHTVR